jgi:WD40 repeat protein
VTESLAPPESRAHQAPATPYVGLVPYGEEDADFFFGRDAESKIVSGNLRAARLTILYGPSGVGKTSLLRAGVLHDLRDKVLARADVRGERAPLAICAFSAWRDDPLPALVETIRASVAEAVGEDVSPPNPAESLVETLRGWTQSVRTLLVVLDQFEEYFLYHQDDEGAGTLAGELPEVVNDANLRVNLLLSIREDAWARLDRFEGQIPGLFANYVRVDHLDRDGAREAIEGPLGEWNRRLPSGEEPYDVEPVLVDAVIDAAVVGRLAIAEMGDGAVAGEADGNAVEAPFLQLVMERLWRATVEAGSCRLTIARLEALGGAQEIVKRHLLDALRGLTPAEQAIAAESFRFLVTRSNTKIAQSASDLADWMKRPEAEVAAVLDRLSQAESGRILRPVSAPAGEDEGRSYELFHDVLAEPVSAWRRAFEHEQARRRAIRRFASIAAGLLVLVAMFAALGIWALVQQREAASQRDAAVSTALAIQALDRVRTQPDLAMLLALEGYRTSHTVEALSAGLAVVARSARLKAVRRAGDVHAVALRDGGRTVIAADERGTVTLWRLSTTLLGPPVKWSVPGSRFEFAANGDVLGGENRDGDIQLWSTRSRRRLGRPFHQRGPVMSFALSRDGRTLASAVGDNLVQVWSVASHRPLGRPFRQPWASLSCLAFSPDGSVLASSGARGLVLWDVAHERALGSPVRRGRDAQACAFRGDGKVLATDSPDGTVRLWDTASHRPLGSPIEYGAPVSDVAFSSDGTRLAVSGDDGLARVWDLEPRRLVAAFRHGIDVVWKVAFTPDGTDLVTAGDDGTVRLWDVRRGFRLANSLGRGRKEEDVAFSSDGTILASVRGARDNKHSWLTLWDVDSRRRVEPPLEQPGDVGDIALSPDGLSLAVGSDGGTVVWDVRKRRPRLKLREPGCFIWSGAFNPAGTALASAGSCGTVTLWDSASGHVLQRPLQTNEAVSDVAFSPNGEILASADDGGRVGLVDLGAHRSLPGPPREQDSVMSVAFTRDDTIAYAAGAGHVRLWDVQERRQIGSPLRQDGASALSVSPDGRTLASIGNETITLWDLASRQSLGEPLPYGDSALPVVEFDPNGKLLASAAFGSRLTLWTQILWSRDLRVWKSRLCPVAGRNLTRAEWNTFVPGKAYRKTCERWAAGS